jgi:hypothetical protein
MPFLLFCHFTVSQISNIAPSIETVFRDHHSQLLGSPTKDWCNLRSVDFTDFVKECEQSDCTVIACTDPNSLADNETELECVREFCRTVCVLERSLIGCTKVSTTLLIGVFLTIVLIISLIIGVIACCYCGCIVRCCFKQELNVPTTVNQPPSAELYPVYPVSQNRVEHPENGYGELEDLNYEPACGYQPNMYGNAAEAYDYSVEAYPPQYPQ